MSTVGDKPPQDHRPPRSEASPSPAPSRFKDETATKPAVPPESDREQKRNLAYLVVLAGVSAGEMFKLQEERTVVGRGPKVGVRLNDEGVSREHCAFVRAGDKIVVEDLGSTNGTFCNGIRVDKRELADGDKIMVGSSTILKFTYHDYLDEVFQRQMYESALRDGLTKVFNKKYFTDYLEKEFAFASRHGGNLALIFLDIDFFKKINDGYGHPAGDFVLAELSQMMVELLRTEDVLARFGGEEFTVLCRGSDLAGARVVAERLRKAVEDRKFTFGGKDIPVTISLGVAAVPESGIADHNAFLASADKALYEAKRSGRNRVCLHGTEKTPVPRPRRSTRESGPV
jgi:diguanylate cyclase (GGDEF)-like protein